MLNCPCKDILATGGFPRTRWVSCVLCASVESQKPSPWPPFSGWARPAGHLGRYLPRLGRRRQEMKITTNFQGRLCSESMLKLSVDFPWGRRKDPSGLKECCQSTWAPLLPGTGSRSTRAQPWSCMFLNQQEALYPSLLPPEASFLLGLTPR